MSDKLSDEQLLKIWKCANGTHPDLGIFTRMVIDYGRAVLAAASPAPAIPAEPVPPFGWVQPRGGNYFTRSELSAKRVGGLIPVWTTPPTSAAPAISESEDAARWIATSDRLPSSAEGVLVAVEFFGPGDWRIKVGYLGEQGGWHVFGGSWTPTHWMPLPEPPIDAARKGEKS
ncbi:DUF551 domain-containing protein [Burkholderia glumae]|uniref:DUF551 domain-containing protein n=1 Tax=Burkholderia glumae TaxID=337 RepID=UPI002151E963|nr:DUF551 domain-containing protein [Burkholderia glumae]UVS93515.1 DUF551 domain-containing protein [Burkholderia glumae]